MATRVLCIAGLTLAGLVACGDASNTSANHFTGIGTNNSGGGSGGGGGGAVDAGGGGVTDSGGGESGTPPSQAFDVMTDKASYDIELRGTTTVQVTVAPQSFTGSVTLSVTNLPTGVTGTFASSSLNVSGTTGATTTLTITTPSTIVPGAAPFQVVGTSGAHTNNAAVSLNVLSQITIQIPMNVAALEGTSGSPSTNAFGAYPIVMNAPANFGTANPIAVRFLNLDSAPHCIHASNATEGFPHDAVTNGVCNTLMQKGQYDQTAHPVNTKGSYLFYLHDQGDLTDGMIKIQ